MDCVSPFRNIRVDCDSHNSFYSLQGKDLSANKMAKMKRLKVKKLDCKEIQTPQAPLDSGFNDVSSAEPSPLESTAAAKSFCEQIRANVRGLTAAECHLLLAMVQSGREIRVMAKAASRMWGEEFDGGTAEIVGPMVYRQILKRMNCFNELHHPAPSVERIGQVNGYGVDFLTPDYVYRIQGNGLCRLFSPRYMPVSGMDIEDVMYALDIIDEHEAQSESESLV